MRPSATSTWSPGHVNLPVVHMGTYFPLHAPAGRGSGSELRSRVRLLGVKACCWHPTRWPSAFFQLLCILIFSSINVAIKMYV